MCECAKTQNHRLGILKPGFKFIFMVVCKILDPPLVCLYLAFDERDFVTSSLSQNTQFIPVSLVETIEIAKSTV